MLLAPVAIMEQSKSSQKAIGQELGTNKVYGEVTLTEFQGQTNVKLNFGKAVRAMTQDKMLIADIDALSKIKFTSVSDALNTLSAYGWNVETTYSIETRTGLVTTMIISKSGVRLVKPKQKEGQTPAKGKKK